MSDPLVDLQFQGKFFSFFSCSVLRIIQVVVMSTGWGFHDTQLDVLVLLHFTPHFFRFWRSTATETDVDESEISRSAGDYVPFHRFSRSGWR